MSNERPPRAPGFSTRAIHADRGENPTRSLAPAIFQTSTFRWESPESGMEFAEAHAPSDFYTRYGNPNTRQLETLVASLEGAGSALAVASGMAAATVSVMPWLSAGDHVVAARTLYGDVGNLLRKLLPKYGVECTVVPTTDPADYAKAMRPNTRVVVIETPANPTLDCVDIRAVAGIARARGARLVVDNTFATPVNTRPMELGAHGVFHSATKYLGGHSDVSAGVVVSDEASVRASWEFLRITGPTLGPMDAWLVVRGLRTLALRMERHNANGARVAAFLESHAGVAKVNYPGLASHASHDVARRQMAGFGAMMSIELAREGTESALAFVRALKLFTPATSLGGVESLVQFPAVLSRMTPEQQRAAGVSPTLIRLSIGCEDAEDLCADLEQALERAPLPERT